MNATDIRATCCKCGAGLKYPVTIGNKVYGSTCASKHLGIHDIPDKWSGNYDDLKAGLKAKKVGSEALNNILREKWTTRKAELEKWAEEYTPDVKRMNKAYYNHSNDWEGSFLQSISYQTGIPILGDIREWEINKFSYLDCEPKGLKSLSDKQAKLFERIEKNG